TWPTSSACDCSTTAASARTCPAPNYPIGWASSASTSRAPPPRPALAADFTDFGHPPWRGFGLPPRSGFGLPPAPPRWSAGLGQRVWTSTPSDIGCPIGKPWTATCPSQVDVQLLANGHPSRRPSWMSKPVQTCLDGCPNCGLDGCP